MVDQKGWRMVDQMDLLVALMVAMLENYLVVWMVVPLVYLSWEYLLVEKTVDSLDDKLGESMAVQLVYE